jgi:hypothetical protein
VLAIDTNILVFSEIVSSPHHRRARNLVKSLAEGARPWAIPWPCFYEFLRVVTHPRIFHPPMPMDRALAGIEALLASPSVELISETSRHLQVVPS